MCIIICIIVRTFTMVRSLNEHAGTSRMQFTCDVGKTLRIEVSMQNFVQSLRKCSSMTLSARQARLAPCLDAKKTPKPGSCAGSLSLHTVTV
jgi:hypothetical protein